jgi:hypothetical protein
MEIKIYKIENEEGLFSTGTRNPKWTKKGKIWQSFGAVKLHLRQFCSDWEFGEDYKTRFFWKNNIPEEWIVVEITNNDTERWHAKDLYPPTDKE